MQQSCINHQMAGFPLYCLRNCFLVAPLLVHFCQSRLIGPTQPIIATAGKDITLPCHLVPGENVAVITFEWTRPDLDPRFVFLWRAGQDLMNMKNPSYKGRSSLFTDELKHGNISLKLSKVKPADEGRYRCYIPEKDEEVFIDLVVGAISSPVINLEGIGRDKTGVVLECKSAGWYPEPELLWLDGEGNLLSAGPTETLRGPDDLYTVSSRVTVEKRHSNNITCRVQQRNTNQSRETGIHVPDEHFQLTSSSAAPIIIGVVVSLAVSIILIVIVVFFFWRRNKTNVRKPHCLRKKQETTKTEPDREQETLMTQDIESSGGSTTLTQHQQLMEKNIKKEKSSKTELEKKQHAAEEKLKEEHHHLEKKHAEISNMKKEEENLETDKKLKEDEKQDFQQEAKQPDVTEVVNPQNTPEHETPRRTNTNTIVATTEMRAEESPGWRHPAGTEQKPQESVVTSSQTQPAAGCTRADRRLSPETRGPRAPHTPTGAHQNQGGQARPSSHQEEKHEADKKLNEDEKQDFQQEEKQLPTKDFWKQQGVSKHTGFQEHNKSSSANYNLKTGDIILDEFDGHAPYICLKNTSSEDKLLTRWDIELQINNKKTLTYKFERNFTLKAREGLTLRGAGVRNPNPDNADLMWQELFKWKSEDDLKISLISSTGEKHQLEKKQHAAEEKLKEEHHHHHLQKKHAEISNMKKEPEKSKPQPEKSQTSFEEQNKSGSANHSSKTGDITVVEVEKNGNYICLKNTSSEDKLMSGWKLKLQINNRESATYEFKENFILKAGETLLLRQDAVNKPMKTDADLLWMSMVNWNIGDDVKIDLIGNTGEEQMLLKNKIM